MTALSQGIKRKLSMLQLAEELGNVAKGLPHHGVPPRHLHTFYEMRRAFQVGGLAALVESYRSARATPGIAEPPQKHHTCSLAGSMRARSNSRTFTFAPAYTNGASS